ncbi:MAG TPA: hypothetical protein VFN61_01375 [Acidimicrobiales bacterium]|nr:hypothetical protein [Acidimicrobiales bacterium]
MTATPRRVGTCALVSALAYVLARILVAAHGNIGALVLLGHTFVHPTAATAGMPIRAGSGYDGQFYYRMALGPSDFARQAFGVTLDSLGRLSRIGYPALVWLCSFGNPGAAEVAMVVVNVIAFGLLAAAGAALCKEVGRSPAWGLALTGFAGLLWSLGRDLTEVSEAALFVLALLYLRRGRPLPAGAALAMAVLTREPALVLAGALLLVRLATAGPLARHLRLERPLWARSRWADAAWAVPFSAFAAWQLTVWSATGTFPLSSSSRANIGAPFVALARAGEHYAGELPHIAALLWFSELALLLGLTVGAGFAVARRSLLLYEALAWVALVTMSVCLGNGVWAGDVGFRSMDDLWSLGCLALVATRWSLRWPARVAGVMWAVVAVELVLFI